ncbi:MAG: undecaprenyl-phosphate glucose phosphotransferase [Burkholderiales bacterium]
MRRHVLKPHAPLFTAALRVSDPSIAIIVGFIVYRAYLGEWLPPEHYLLLLGVAALTIFAILPSFRLYEPQRGASLADELRQLFLAWALLGALMGGVLFATKSGIAFSRVWVMLWLAGSFTATAALRASMRLLLRHLRKRGRNLRHIVIAGAGELGRAIAERLGVATWAGLNVIGFFDDDPAKQGTNVAGRPVIGPVDQVGERVAAGGIDQVWIALPLRAEQQIRDILDALRDHSVDVRFVPDIYSFHLLNHSFTEVAGLPVISLTETPIAGTNRVIKSIEDYLIAALLLLVTLPLWLLLAVGVKITSAGPVFYRQERITWNGQRFSMLKFRSMPQDAEAASGPVWARHREARATRFGAFLRRYSLDELPQLVNVLRGDMSLVGPRPERPEFVQRFRQQIPGYMQKHLVKAGITGWAQVNDLRGDTDLEQRIKCDLYYIDNWSIWFDLRILGLTLWHILTSRNAH